MKKLLGLIWAPLLAIGAFFAGFLIRQPKINKLKKQIVVLQTQIESIQDKMIGYQESFDNLLVQYKGLKVLQLRKKAEYEGKLKDNLVLQYGMKDYLNLLIDSVKHNRKLSSIELSFYQAFDDILEGKQVGASDFAKIKKYVLEKHSGEISALKPCDCTYEFRKIQEYRAS